jgi:hypothetical protein
MELIAAAVIQLFAKALSVSPRQLWLENNFL